MDIRRLRNFVTVVEVGSIVRAAHHLHIAQPALSTQMRQLEAFAGCQLLRRSSQGVSPTEAGIEFARLAEETLRTFEAMKTFGGKISPTLTGHIEIGLPVSASEMVAVALVAAVRSAYPSLTLGLQESPSVFLGELLLRGRVDIAVLFGDAPIPGIKGVTVAEEDLFVIGKNIPARRMKLEALAREELVMPAHPNAVRSLLEAACQELGLRLKVALEVSSPHTMIHLASAGYGFTIQPWSMLNTVKALGLSAVRIESPKIGRKISVATASNAPKTPQLLAVKELLIEVVQSLVSGGERKGARLIPLK